MKEKFIVKIPNLTLYKMAICHMDTHNLEAALLFILISWGWLVTGGRGQWACLWN